MMNIYVDRFVFPHVLCKHDLSLTGHSFPCVRVLADHLLMWIDSTCVSKALRLTSSRKGAERDPRQEHHNSWVIKPNGLDVAARRFAEKILASLFMLSP